jgi:hypothetical protein
MQIWCVTFWMPNTSETAKCHEYFMDEARALTEAKKIDIDPRIEVRIKPIEVKE